VSLITHAGLLGHDITGRRTVQEEIV
jgi:hypothetical protein